jgi:hypothetical protein
MRPKRRSAVNKQEIAVEDKLAFYCDVMSLPFSFCLNSSGPLALFS